MDKYKYTILFKNGKELSISSSEFKVLTAPKSWPSGQLLNISAETYVLIGDIVAIYRSDK